MANSVHTKMQGLIDLISRPSRPPNAPAQQGDAFRKSMMDPDGPAPEKATTGMAPAGEQASSGKAASSDLNWVEGDSGAIEDAAQTGKSDGAASPEETVKAEAEDAAAAASAELEDTPSETGDRDEAGAQAETAVAAVSAPATAAQAEGSADEGGGSKETKANHTPHSGTPLVFPDKPSEAAQAIEPAQTMAPADHVQEGARTPADSQVASPAPVTAPVADAEAPANDVPAGASSKGEQEAAADRGRQPDRASNLPIADRPSSGPLTNETAAAAASPVAAAAIQKDASRGTPPQASAQAAAVQHAAPQPVRGVEQGKDKLVHPAGERHADTLTGIMSPAAMTPPEETLGQHALSDTMGKPESLFSVAQPAAGAPGPAINVANGIVLQGMQANAAMIATPPEVVDIVRAKLAGTDGSDRITVQLDPPELGRVSIDFKFDAQQGLQHITVTGDTPEAMRQLRQLHFQLAQALEQHGLSSQDMTFRQNSSQQDQQPSGRLAGGPLSFAEDELVAQTLTAANLPNRARTIAAGLDIKL